MARGDLSVEVQARIDGLLPDPGSRFDEILELSPDELSIAFSPESDIPVASVCLLDALRTISAARYALFECHAHGIYYRDVVNPSQEMNAIWFEQFYVQDAAHRLYGAAEDIAEGLVKMLEVSDSSLKLFKRRAVSQQAAVGRLLLTDHPGLAISNSIRELTGSTAWIAAMDYRGRLVHDQAPLVSGLGVVHRRQRRWRKTENSGLYLALGGGDPPEFDTTALIAICRDALVALLAVWDESLVQFMKVLQEKGGIRRSPDGVLAIPDYFRGKLGRPEPRERSAPPDARSTAQP
jgi:hypothetical protein